MPINNPPVGGGGGGASVLTDLTDYDQESPLTGQGLFISQDGSTKRNITGFRFPLHAFLADADAPPIPSYRFFGLYGTAGQHRIFSDQPVFTSDKNLVGKVIYVGQMFSGGRTITAVDPSGFYVDYGAGEAAIATGSSNHNRWGSVEGYDWTSVITAAAAAAKAAGGGIVEAATGHYAVSGNMVWPSNVWMEGSYHGTVFFLKAGTAVASPVDMFRTEGYTDYALEHTGTQPDNGVYGFGFDSVVLDMNVQNNNNANCRHALAIYGYDYFLNRLCVRNSCNSGIRTEYDPSTANTPAQMGTGPGGSHTFWNRILVQNCGTDNGNTIHNNAIDHYGPHDSKHFGIDVYAPGNDINYGINDSGGANQWNQCHVWGNCAFGINLGASRSLVTDSQFEGCADGQIRIASSENVITHCRIYGVHGSTADLGIYVASGRRNIVTAMSFADFDQGCLFFGTSTSGEDSIFEGTISYHEGTVPGPVVSVISRVQEPQGTRIKIKASGGQGERDIMIDPHSVLLGPTVAQLEEHFISGGNNATSGLGNSGFASGGIGGMAGGTATFVVQDSEVGHPGLLRISTGAVANTGGYLSDRSASTTGNWHPSEYMIYAKAVLRINVLDAETIFRWGFMRWPDTTNADPTDRICFERLAADGTTLYAVTRSASGTALRTAVPSLTLAASTWYTLEIVKGVYSDGGTLRTAWKFYVNGILRVVHISGGAVSTTINAGPGPISATAVTSSQIPSNTQKLAFQLAYATGGTLGAKTMDVDYVCASLKTAP